MLKLFRLRRSPILCWPEFGRDGLSIFFPRDYALFIEHFQRDGSKVKHETTVRPFLYRGGVELDYLVFFHASSIRQKEANSLPKTSVVIDVRGTKETLAQIDLRNKKVRKAVQEQVGKSALNIQREAKKRCPVDTGALRNSITVDFYGEMSAQIGPHMPYAPYVEFGTRKMPAKPYLFPAFEEERPKFEQGLAEAIKGATE